MPSAHQVQRALFYVMKRIIMSATIFHKIINREIPATIEYETDTLIVIHDIHPQAPFHFLIIPKKSIRSVNELEKSDTHLIFEMLQTAKLLAIRHHFVEQGYRIVMNCEEWGGQTVFQLHMHVLAGKQLTGGFS